MLPNIFGVSVKRNQKMGQTATTALPQKAVRISLTLGTAQPSSSYSSRLTHIFLKLASAARIEPPIHVESCRSGGAWRSHGWPRQFCFGVGGPIPILAQTLTTVGTDPSAVEPSGSLVAT